MKNRIWLDVTVSSRWNGPAVGMIRTERKIIEELKKNYGERFHLFIYDSNGFHETDLSKKTELGGNQTKPKSVATSLLFPVIGKKQALKNIAQGFISLSPQTLRPFVNLLSLISARCIKELLRLKKKARQNSNLIKKEETNIGSDVLTKLRNALPKSIKKPHPFNEGDVIITLSAVWDYPSMLDDLFFLKREINLKFVTLCYDLIPIIYPQYCLESTVSTFGSYILGLADISDVICCISRSTRKDLEKFLVEAGAKVPPTKLLYLGCDIRQEKSNNSDSLDEESPFILYVSTLERRKNHEVLYKAYRKLIEKGCRKEIPDLYFVGMEGWGVSDLIKDVLYDPLLQGKIKILGRLNDDELESLYKRAYFVVFPSFYEGWGLAIIEAFLYGKFVLASDRGSLPEAGAGFAECIDPYDVNLWAEKILYYSRNPTEVKRREALIKSEWRPLKWSETAKTLATIVSETID